MAMFIKDPKAGFLPDAAPASANVGETRLARWYERLRGIVLRNPEPASRTYRYMSRLIEREFAREGSGVCLAFSSTDDDKASTDALLMLAYCLRSELDSRVLVIDARLKEQARGITGRLGLLQAPGFAEIIQEGFAGNEALVVPTRVSNVDVLPSGDPRGVGTVAVDRERLGRLLEATRQRYDHVLLQLGSVLRDTRNVVTAAQCDAVFLVVEENRTFMQSLDDCRRQLLDNGIEDVRVIVTGGKP